MMEDGQTIIINGKTFRFFPMKGYKAQPKQKIIETMTLNALVLNPAYLRRAAEDYRKFVEGNDVIRD